MRRENCILLNATVTTATKYSYPWTPFTHLLDCCKNKSVSLNPVIWITFIRKGYLRRLRIPSILICYFRREWKRFSPQALFARFPKIHCRRSVFWIVINSHTFYVYFPNEWLSLLLCLLCSLSWWDNILRTVYSLL